jgi:class 3 adenylate cyclase
MFCDLVGSTAISARLDPEDLRDVITAYHRAVARLDGLTARYMCDGMFGLFPLTASSPRLSLPLSLVKPIFRQISARRERKGWARRGAERLTERAWRRSRLLLE